MSETLSGVLNRGLQYIYICAVYIIVCMPLTFKVGVLSDRGRDRVR